MTGPSGQNPLNLCGTLTNFHIYIENARSTTSSTLAFTIATGGTWKIKVSQIECSNLARAYPDCDQFVTGASGTISSYNWANVQLRAKDYQHCIRREMGYCGIQLSQAVPTSSPDSFETEPGTVSENGVVAATVLGYITLPGCVSNVGGCQYLGSLFTDGYTAIAANTNDIPGSVIVSNHMFRIEHTQLNLAQTSMYGWKLQYHQIPCTGSITSYISTGY